MTNKLAQYDFRHTAIKQHRFGEFQRQESRIIDKKGTVALLVEVCRFEFCI